MDAPTENARRYKWLPADQQGLPATMASAAIAGLCSRIVMHPIDTAKTVIQVRTKTEFLPGTLLGRSKTLQTLSSVWNANGIRGLYRGFGITSTLAVPGTCLYFSTYELLKARLIASQRGTEEQESAPSLSFGRALLLDLVCGFSAEAVSCIFYLPMDVCKERLQVYSAMEPKYLEGKKPTLMTVARMNGIHGLYRGYGATLLSFGPFSALFFTLNCKPATSSQQTLQERLPFLDATVAAAAAGAAAFVTAPLDKVKLRLQVQSDSGGPRQTPFYYKNAFHGLASLFKTEGLSGCFGGVGARTMFQSGTFFMMFLFMQNARNAYCRYFEG